MERELEEEIEGDEGDSGWPESEGDEGDSGWSEFEGDEGDNDEFRFEDDDEEVSEGKEQRSDNPSRQLPSDSGSEILPIGQLSLD